MKPSILISTWAAALFVPWAGAAFGQVIASDTADPNDPAYVDGWQEGDNGGTGFLAWTGGMYASPWEIDTDAPEADNQLGTPAFRYGGGAGGGYWAIRPLATPMAAGQSFSLDFDQFAYPTLENPFPAQSQSLVRLGTDSVGGQEERFSLYNYYYNDGTSVFGEDLKWGIGAATAFDNLNGGVALPAGISGWLTDYTIPESTDGFSLTLDILTIDTYRFRIVDDGETVVDVSGQLRTETAGQEITAITFWSEGGNIDTGEPTSYFDNLQIAVTPPDGVPGDYNDSGTVDAADYVTWRDGGPLANEGASTGIVDQADYDFWRARFGATAGAGADFGPATVPEPSTALLLVALSVALLPARTRHGG
jgi:hypothetical protein